jgi:hypothetical protein
VNHHGRGDSGLKLGRVQSGPEVGDGGRKSDRRHWPAEIWGPVKNPWLTTSVLMWAPDPRERVSLMKRGIF